MIGTAGEALETGNGAVQDIATAIEKANPALDELSSVLQSFRETLARVDHFAAEAENNDGLLKALRDDPELKRDFIDLIDKLETNGIIFYPRERERNSIFSPRGVRRN